MRLKSVKLISRYGITLTQNVLSRNCTLNIEAGSMSLRDAKISESLSAEVHAGSISINAEGSPLAPSASHFKLVSHTGSITGSVSYYRDLIAKSHAGNVALRLKPFPVSETTLQVNVGNIKGNFTDFCGQYTAKTSLGRMSIAGDVVVSTDSGSFMSHKSTGSFGSGVGKITATNDVGNVDLTFK